MSEEKKYDPYTGYEIDEKEATYTDDARESETVIVGESGSYYEDTAYTDYNAGQSQTNQGNQTKSVSNMPIIAMILGISSIVLTCCCPPISVILGIVAIVLAILSPKNNGVRDGKAVAGLVCGIIGTVCTIIMIVALIAFSGSSFIQDELQDELDYYEQEYQNDTQATTESVDL